MPAHQSERRQVVAEHAQDGIIIADGFPMHTPAQVSFDGRRVLGSSGR
jgi:hypothetical protein